MIRKGTYTKRVTPVTRSKRFVTRRWRWFKALSRTKKVLVVSAPIVTFLIATPLLTYLYYAKDISDQERLMNRNNTGIVLLDDTGEAFYRSGRAERRTILPQDQMAPELTQALLASEDKDFYKHGGFSPLSIAKAMYGNILARDATGYGGSTLTQQLAKNTLLSSNQTFLRKYQELAVSVAIERQYSKDEILEMYLNSVYFGEDAFGVEDAARAYFNKTPKELNLAESAMLIGLLPAPTAYSPISGSLTYATQRQNTVLTRMVTNGYISNDQKRAATSQVLSYAQPKSIDDTIAPHFVQMTLEQLYQKYGEEKVTRSGYQVRTTLDMTLQKSMTESVSRHMPYVQANGGSNAGAVAIDPESGEVRALVGSAEWNNPTWGRVNMATTARQPGSSFKPLYYAEALAQGKITPSTLISDTPTDFNGYKPKNASRTYSGDVTVRSALSRSLNIPAVKVLQKIGVSEALETAKRMGITTLTDTDTQYGLSLALGSAEVPLLEMTNAYAAFANGGQRFAPTIIHSINTKFDTTIFTAKQKPKKAQTAEGSYLISSILSDNNARASIFGSSLTVRGKTVAVKTGTTDDNRDAWTIGYSPKLAVGVWVGNNNNDAMLSGGSGMAGPIWRTVMTDALSNGPDVAFTVPSGVIQKSVCYSNGGLSSGPGNGTYSEYFLASALPTLTCAPVKKPTKPEEPVKPEPSVEVVETCPDGQTGTPPDCKVAPVKEVCPTGQTGVPPNCREPVVEPAEPPVPCEGGSTDTPPGCRPPSATPPSPRRP